MRWLRLTLLGLLGLVLVLVALAAWAVTTQSGTRIILARIVLPLTPAHVSEEDIHGRLIGPLALDHVGVELADGRADIARMELEWRPARLLRGVAHLERLQIDGARVALRDGAPPPDEEEPFELDLPLTIQVDRLEIRDASVLQDGEPLIADVSALLSLEARGEAVRIDGLQARADRGGVEGHARVSGAADGDWDVDLRWHWQLDAPANDEQAEDALGGHVLVRGVLSDLAVALDVGGLVDGALSARVQGLPAEAVWDAELEVEPLPRRPDLWPETLDGAGGHLTSQGRVEDLRLQGVLSLPALIAGDIGAEASLGWRDGALALDRVRIELEQGGRMAGHGLVRPEEELQVALELAAEDLRWPTNAEDPQLNVPALRFELEGEPGHFVVDGEATVRVAGLPDAALAARGEWRDPVLKLEQLRFEAEEAGIRGVGEGVARIAEEGIDYVFDLDGSLRQPGLPEVHFRAAGRGDPGGVALQHLRAEALDGSLVGGGTLRWADGVHLDFNWTARDIDPRGYWPQWPGRVGGEVRVRGAILPERDLTVSISPLEGALRERPVRGHLEARLEDEVLDVTRGEVRLGESLLRVSGRLAAERAPEPTAIELAVDSRDLEDLHPDARGALAASAVVRGTVEAPVLSMALEGSELGWHGYALDAIVANLQLDLADPRQDSRLAVELSGLRGEEPLLDSLSLNAAGTAAEHHVRLAGERAAAEWRVALAGTLNDGLEWRGRLEELLVGADEEPLWRLASPASLAAGADHARLEAACLGGGRLGETCVAAEWHAEEGWQARLGLTDLELHDIGEWLGGELVVQGRVAGDIIVRGNAEGFEHLAGEVELAAGSLTPDGFPDEPLLAWNRSTLTLSGDRAQAVAEALMDLGEHGGIEGRLQIGWNDEDPALDGRLAAELTHAELVSVFVQELTRIEGRIGAAVDLGGTLGQPSLRGEVFWQDGAASSPEFGMRAHDIELRGTISDEEGLRFTAFARAGDGELRSEGRFTLPPRPLTGEARVWGREALIIDVPGMQVLATPELTLNYREDRIIVEGDVQLPWGRITSVTDPETPETVAEISPDEFVIGAEAEEIEQGEEPELSFDIRVLIGPDFTVDAEGLAAEIEGYVQVMQGPEGEPVGRGEVNILDGSFTLFEEPLIVSEGRLFFSDTPLDNPALDLQAEVTTEDVVVGAFIRGSLVEPEVTLYSDPPMPEAEALSYMITGRGLHDLSTGEADIVHSAANAPMMAAAELLERQVGARLGFDTMGATGGAEPGSADLVIGLHLGSRLFVSYGVGLYEAVSAMRVRYRLTQRWAVEVISGDVSSIDLMSTRER